jgi:hypothetical protein
MVTFYICEDVSFLGGKKERERGVWNVKKGGEMSKKQQLRLRFDGPTKFFSLIFSFLFLTLRLRLELNGDRSDSTVTTL